ncbi:MAG: hypothetical protein M1838_004122 [Thelocarpon superellum]|nr:MAG: hypothetical protein M1838_004122 [Thelocarpon superellum]
MPGRRHLPFWHYAYASGLLAGVPLGALGGNPWIPSLPNTAVPPEERVYCGEDWGQDIVLSRVEQAAQPLNLKEGSRIETYHTTPPKDDTFLPRHHEDDSGQVYVEVEIVGYPRSSYAFAPDQIREAVGWIARECVGEREGVGGFATLGRGVLLDYPSEAHTPEGSFIGITVTTREKDFTGFGNNRRVLQNIIDEIALEDFDGTNKQKQRFQDAINLGSDLDDLAEGLPWFFPAPPPPRRQGLSCKASTTTPNATAYGATDEAFFQSIATQWPAGNVTVRQRKPLIQSFGSTNAIVVRSRRRGNKPIQVPYHAIAEAGKALLAQCAHDALTIVSGSVSGVLSSSAGPDTLPRGITVDMMSFNPVPADYGSITEISSP